MTYEQIRTELVNEMSVIDEWEYKVRQDFDAKIAEIKEKRQIIQKALDHLTPEIAEAVGSLSAAGFFWRNYK